MALAYQEDAVAIVKVTGMLSIRAGGRVTDPEMWQDWGQFEGRRG